MSETVKWIGPYNQEGAFQRWWSSRTFIQRRLIRFCLSMLVMVVCFPLYYLGLFGSVEGPLNPARLGERLAGLGVTQTHSMVLFLSFLIIAVSWNWIYNLVSLVLGLRLSCIRPNAAGKPCGAAVRRIKVKDRKTGKLITQYVCTHGHKRLEANFHPVKKSSISHTIWVISLTFCVIVFCSAHWF